MDTEEVKTKEIKPEEKENNKKNKKEEKLKEKIKLLEEEINLEKDKLVRNQAELLNYKKRKDEETAKMFKYANSEFGLDILSIVDNFEAAIKMDDNNLTDEVSKFLEGFKMIYSRLIEIMKKNDIVEIDCLHKEFDPTYHQAVMTKEESDFEDNIILEVFQKGYMYKDRLLRPAMVVVNNNLKKEGNDNNE